MTNSIEEVLKKHSVKIRGMATQISHGFGGVQNIDDLEAVGNVALWQCHLRFDPKLFRVDDFWRYAQPRVKWAMFDYLREEDHLSRRSRKLLKNEEAGEVPWAIIHRVPMTAAAQVAAESKSHAELLDRFQLGYVERLLTRLSDRHQQVVRMYFLDGLKLAKIGKLMMISEGRVSQLKVEALKLLRDLVSQEEEKIGP